MATTVAQCKDIRKRLEEAIADEAKAGPDYQKLASDTKEMFCGGKCPKGFIAQIGLQTLSVDEHKHHDFLVQLLAAVNDHCEEEQEKRGLLGPPPRPLSEEEKGAVIMAR